MNELKLSTRTSMLLSKYHDNMIDKQKRELEIFSKKTMLEFLSDGISACNAPLELAGRMFRANWSYVEYDKSKPSWRILTLDFRELYVKPKDIENMLELKE